MLLPAGRPARLLQDCGIQILRFVQPVCIRRVYTGQDLRPCSRDSPAPVFGSRWRRAAQPCAFRPRPARKMPCSGGMARAGQACVPGTEKHDVNRMHCDWGGHRVKFRRFMLCRLCSSGSVPSARRGGVSFFLDCCAAVLLHDLISLLAETDRKFCLLPPGVSDSLALWFGPTC